MTIEGSGTYEILSTDFVSCWITTKLVNNMRTPLVNHRLKIFCALLPPSMAVCDISDDRDCTGILYVTQLTSFPSQWVALMSLYTQVHN